MLGSLFVVATHNVSNSFSNTSMKYRCEWHWYRKAHIYQGLVLRQALVGTTGTQDGVEVTVQALRSEGGMLESLSLPMLVTSPLMRDSYCTGIGLSIPHHLLFLEPKGKSHSLVFE